MLHVRQDVHAFLVSFTHYLLHMEARLSFTAREKWSENEAKFGSPRRNFHSEVSCGGVHVVLGESNFVGPHLCSHFTIKPMPCLSLISHSCQ